MILYKWFYLWYGIVHSKIFLPTYWCRPTMRLQFQTWNISSVETRQEQWLLVIMCLYAMCFALSKPQTSTRTMVFSGRSQDAHLWTMLTLNDLKDNVANILKILLTIEEYCNVDLKIKPFEDLCPNCGILLQWFDNDDNVDLKIKPFGGLHPCCGISSPFPFQNHFPATEINFVNNFHQILINYCE